MRLSDDQVALRDTVRLLLSRESDTRAAVGTKTGYDEELWARLCTEVGVAALAMPETYGGLGATLLETVVVQSELGRALTPSPMLGSAVLAAQAVLATGDDETCRALLPAIAAGTTVAALAWAGAGGRWSPEKAAYVASQAAGGWTLDGEAAYVLDGDTADVLIVVAHTAAGLALFQVAPAETRRVRAETMDPTRRLATVTLAGTPARQLGVADLGRVRDLACVALCAEQAGAAARCLELTVSYTKQRTQFGRPIGGFQALKHRMADLHVLVETAESASLAAATAAVHGPADELAARAAVAKTYCSEAFCAVAGEMIQLHGGIAITWEHDAHLYFKRAHGSAQLFGRPQEHVARFAELVGM